MTSEIDAVRRALEAAAKVCELRAMDGSFQPSEGLAATYCAESIRALRAEDFIDQREAAARELPAAAADTLPSVSRACHGRDADSGTSAQQPSQSASHHSPAEQVLPDGYFTHGGVAFKGDTFAEMLAKRNAINPPAEQVGVLAAPIQEDSRPASAGGPSAVEEVTAKSSAACDFNRECPVTPFYLADRHAEELDRLRQGVVVPEDVFTSALAYIKHCGSNQVARGLPHPQQWLVEALAAAKEGK